MRSAARAILLLLSAVHSATHYETLGVQRSATTAQIKRAYYKLAKTLHRALQAPHLTHPTTLHRHEYSRPVCRRAQLIR